MPLMNKKSKAAFEHNVKAEMHAGKPQNQSLAIAYSVKRKAKKASGGTVESGSPTMNYAKGGMVNESAASERRPMPEETDKDAAMVSRNSGKKAPSQDSWTDRPDQAQLQSNNGRKVKPIKHPSMVQSPVFKARLRNQEDDLMDSASPGPYGAQPPKEDDELDAQKQGSDPDMADEHSTRRKPYAKGGEVEASDYNHQAKNKYEDDLTDLSPSEDEAHMYADSHNEMGADRQGPQVPDMEEPHNDEEDKVYGYAEGGMADSDDQYDDEEEMDHAASVAAAIMAKRRKFARGGAILSEDSMETTDDDQADLSRTAEEDANMEDKASFDALRKENYSESDGLHQADHPEDSNMHSPEHEQEDVNDGDIVSAIRRKMRIKSAITK